VKSNLISPKQLIDKASQALAYQYFSLRLKTRNEPHRFILMLSHMRSGSSLLTHILNTNPEISGYGENHADYHNPMDLNRLIFRTAWELKNFDLSEKYVLDKILHDELVISEELLASEKMCFIFLLRRPQETLKSIVKIFSNSKWNLDQAVDYYVSRLASLEKYAQGIDNPERCLFLSHEQLMHQTDQTFEVLQNFLAVGHPFTEEYEILPTTGKKFIGDSSKNIQKGRIVRGQHTFQDSEIVIPPDRLDHALQAFYDCSNTLEKCCTTLDPIQASFSSKR
jgi:hypothetical protein